MKSEIVIGSPSVKRYRKIMIGDIDLIALKKRVSALEKLVVKLAKKGK